MNHLFIVGAQRSGTTYLYQLLQAHPQVTMAQPVRPEAKFFLNDNLCKLGRAYYEQSYFSASSNSALYFGEKGTSYIEIVQAAKRIKKFYPNARILMILRDPVIRAYSNYLFSFQNGLEHLSFEDALSAESRRISESKYKTSVNPFAYRQRGYYIDYIEQYLTIFSSSQLCVLILEEFADNISELRKLYSWLGIYNSFVPDSISQVFNYTDAQKEDQTLVFRELANGYKDSLERLERFLGRKVNFWRRHWVKL